MPKMKTIAVIAGPDGSGKTSLVECMNDKGIIDGFWAIPDKLDNEKCCDSKRSGG